MRRRHFLALAATAAFAPGFAARAEQAGKIWRIGQTILGTDPTAPIATALERHLAELGYEPGKNILLTNRLVTPTPLAEFRRLGVSEQGKSLESRDWPPKGLHYGRGVARMA
jgi:hypothetical protein